MRLSLDSSSVIVRLVLAWTLAACGDSGADGGAADAGSDGGAADAGSAGDASIDGDASVIVDGATPCTPSSGTDCCLDEDEDGYGTGDGCLGSDCDDDDPAVHPGASETCNGVDDDCNGTADDDPTDCGHFVCESSGEAGAACASSCAPTGTDDDSLCIKSAHCDFGVCVPDRPAGVSCGRDGDCESGLTCVDDVCCATACDGVCEACDLAGSEGTCTPLAMGVDPEGECSGFSCSGYYSGFEAAACHQRADVDDTAAVCDGMRGCLGPADLCPSQGVGDVQIECDGTCQMPTAGTCTGEIAGACTDLDDASDTISCGLGSCRRTVQRCVGGVPSTCTPGTPTPETCNGLDDDCDGLTDDGSGFLLCPTVPYAASYSCVAATCRFTCQTGRYDVNGDYADGCECEDDIHANSCTTRTNLGTIPAGGSLVVMGLIVPATEVDWFQVSFGAGGSRRIQLDAASASDFALDVRSFCGGALLPSDGTGWPSTVVVSVRRIVSVSVCADAAYSFTVSNLPSGGV